MFTLCVFGSREREISPNYNNGPVFGLYYYAPLSNRLPNFDADVQHKITVSLINCRGLFQNVDT